MQRVVGAALSRPMTVREHGCWPPVFFLVHACRSSHWLPYVNNLIDLWIATCLSTVAAALSERSLRLRHHVLVNYSSSVCHPCSAQWAGLCTTSMLGYRLCRLHLAATGAQPPLVLSCLSSDLGSASAEPDGDFIGVHRIAV